MDHLVTYSTSPKRHVGPRSDGGYVIVDNLEYDFFISCGIGYETIFDNEFCKLYPDLKGVAFDGTISHVPDLPPQVEFIRKNIGPDETEVTSNLKNFCETYSNIFLKMDIEGFEWSWLNSLESDKHLLKFKQIVMECHGILDDSMEATWNEKTLALQKLAKTHKLVHAHGNNYGPSISYNGHMVPSTLELTFIRNDIPVFGKNTESFPVAGLDYPNNPYAREYSLYFWPFVTNVA